MRAREFIAEKWSKKYKKSINCSHPKGFSQRAHCAGRRKKSVKESITFGVAEYKPYVDSEGKHRQLLTGEKWWRKEMQQCWVCNGTGKEKYDDKEYPCQRCHGKGETEEHVSDAPELNVANANGYAIQDMLGVTNPDHSGTINNKDLPDVMRKLIKLKNKGTNRYTQDPISSRGKMHSWKDEQGRSHISRTATMHDMGRSQRQVNVYLDELIKMIKFAIDNNAHISWG